MGYMGILLFFYPKPYSIYLRGTIVLLTVKEVKLSYHGGYISPQIWFPQDSTSCMHGTRPGSRPTVK